VTSNYHTRRTRFIYGRVLPSNVTFRISSARDSEFDPSRWWETRQGQKLFFTEIVGYVVAWWELRGASTSQNEPELIIVPLSYQKAPQIGQPRPLSFRPVSDWKHDLSVGCTRGLSKYYSLHFTVLSGLLPAQPRLVATEFSVRG